MADNTHQRNPESDATDEKDRTEDQEGGADEELQIVDAEGNVVSLEEAKARHAEAAEESDETFEPDPSKLVAEPAKVMRVGSMVKQLLEEVRSADLDDKGRQRLRDIHQRSIAELESGLAPELRDELERLSLPFSAEETPSEPELRIAQAQLVGWLEGLFHGIQAALVAQQMAARVQLEQMRTGDMKALPPGAEANMSPQLRAVMAERAARGEDHDSHPGQYL
ncbi:bacterial proteasome activator family protein [Haloglycomyces albus]|uniref:bacterial proteasome activator family protein n=1 Tax=Haloglycomyces albus TaxID=526067 RepID=UPI00046CA32E|nr:bacterial proteasome activator family protein [Haloglycomyces albus]